MQIAPSKVITVYCDGACSGNPGIGGWGVVLLWRDKIKKLSGAVHSTTNNQMELQAAIEALKSIKVKKVGDLHLVKVYTDSKYVKEGITKWIYSWIKKNWMRTSKECVKNVELWQELYSLSNDGKGYVVEWHWVKGHSGDQYNDMADQLATDAIKAIKKCSNG